MNWALPLILILASPVLLALGVAALLLSDATDSAAIGVTGFAILVAGALSAIAAIITGIMWAVGA